MYTFKCDRDHIKKKRNSDCFAINDYQCDDNFEIRFNSIIQDACPASLNFTVNDINNSGDA